MSTPHPTEQLVHNGQSYPVLDLTEFGFVSPIEIAAGEKQSSGVLVLGDHELPINFRVRQKKEHGLLCSFANFSISNREIVKKHLSDRSRIGDGGLENRTYDELAKGFVDSPTGQPAASTAASIPASVPPVASATQQPQAQQPQAAPQAPQAQQQPQQRAAVKTFALLAMLFTMIALGVLAMLFMRSRSSLSVSNSALVGNYLPVNAKVEGEIAQVFVNDGDFVEKGDLLFRLVNPEMQTTNQELDAKLITAEATVNAIKKQLKTFDGKLAIATKKLKLDLQVAKSDLLAARNFQESSQAAFDRLKPYVKSGAITQLELDEAENQLRSREAICVSKENQVLQVQFSQEAAKSKVLILGDRLDDEQGRLVSELEIAEAHCKELQLIRKLGLEREQELQIVAPRSGQVYVTYRQVGEFVKVADQVLAISFNGKTWAAGQVTSAQASRVLPGQPVKVKVPSMNLMLDGVVTAVGHRAMYSHGQHTADFRGATATDVPIKVAIEELPEDIPSGLRLEMAINTGFGIGWLDNQMGYELLPIGNASRVKPNLVTKSKLSDEPSLVKKVSLNSSNAETQR